MRILVDSMPEKTDSCPYANRVPSLSHQSTFVCELNQDRDACRGVGKCPVFISYDELMNKKYERNCYKPVVGRNNFVEEVEKHHMTNPLEILNWYRNLYYQEEFPSERRIMAEAINGLFMKYKDVFNVENEVG